MFRRIAIMGAGSLGTILGAYISTVHNNIDLIDVNKDHVDFMNAHGATVCGTSDLKNIPVHAITPEQMKGEYDLFFYMAKQTCNNSCLPKMKEHSHADTYICCCQNGLPEMAVNDFFPADHVFGSPVGWGATFIGPGTSACTTEIPDRYFSLGSQDGRVSDALLEVKSLLECMCPVELSDNLMGQRWSKLHINAAYSGLSTVIGGSFGDVSNNEKALRWAIRIGRECTEITAALNINMIPGHSGTGEDLIFSSLYSFNNPAEELICMSKVRDMNSGSNALIASMLQDLRAGRRCESEAILGVVSEAGRSADVPTPFTDAALAAINAKQSGEIEVEHVALEYCPKFEWQM